MTDTILKLLQKQYEVREETVEPEYRDMKVNGMKFRVRTYEAVGLGKLAVMQAVGFFGLMKMDTVILTGTEKDVPLFSCERILAMGNDTLIVENFNTMLAETDCSGLRRAAQSGAALPDYDPGVHWYEGMKCPGCLYKKAKKARSAQMDELETAAFKAWLELAAAAPSCDREQKRAANAIYVDGLLSNGGPSTDVFMKQKGKDFTNRLFKEVLFFA